MKRFEIEDANTARRLEAVPSVTGRVNHGDNNWLTVHEDEAVASVHVHLHVVASAGPLGASGGGHVELSEDQARRAMVAFHQALNRLALRRGDEGEA